MVHGLCNLPSAAQAVAREHLAIHYQPGSSAGWSLANPVEMLLHCRCSIGHQITFCSATKDRPRLTELAR